MPALLASGLRAVAPGLREEASISSECPGCSRFGHAKSDTVYSFMRRKRTQGKAQWPKRLGAMSSHVPEQGLRSLPTTIQYKSTISDVLLSVESLPKTFFLIFCIIVLGRFHVTFSLK